MHRKTECPKTRPDLFIMNTPRWSLRAALGQAEAEVEGDADSQKKAGKQPHEKLLTSSTLVQTVPERHSS